MDIARGFVSSVALGACLFFCGTSPATAQAPTDRVSFGGDVVVRAGETVQNVVTMGGGATIDGEVLGDVTTMGGDASVNGRVLGDVVTMGGDAHVAPGAWVGGELTTMGGSADVAPGASTGGPVTMHPGGAPEDDLAGFVHGVLTSAASFAFLFLVGLLMLGVAKERFQALQVVTVREPLHAMALGAFGFLGAILATILLCITLIGIPVAIVLVLALWLAGYVGLASIAAVLGAILPVERLRDRPVMQLAAGTTVLFVTSLIPVIGPLALLVAGAIGLGAIARTRLSTMAPMRDQPAGEAPYRSPSFSEGL
jgi:hypothetical protein